MDSPIQNIMAALSPLLPSSQPVKNPVSEFLDNLLTEKYGDAAETELLHLIVVNSANEDPNGVLEMMVDLHDRIGVFVTRVQDGEFKEWTTPEATAADDATIEVGGDASADTDLRQIDTDIRSGEKSAVLELP